MNHPVKGLRSVYNRSNGLAKVSIAIPAGDVLHVSDAVAELLLDGRNGLVEGEPVDRATAPEVATNDTPRRSRKTESR